MRKTTAKDKILDAAVALVRKNGLSGTSVDDLCRAAGVTKGAFFHHFRSKSDLAVSAAHHWSETTGRLFETAPYHAPADALDRLLAYIEFRKILIAGETSEYTCLVGTMAQETHHTHCDIAKACGDSIHGHAATLIADIEQAVADYGLNPEWTTKSLADFTQVVIQGGFILAKAGGGQRAVTDALDHLKNYISLVFREGTHEA